MKPMTITEKILAAHTREEAVEPGQFIEAEVDLALGNDVTTPLAIEKFREAGAKRVFDRDKIVLVPDHFAPNKDIKSAIQCQLMREFAKEQQITHYFEVGRMGIEHCLLPEQGLVKPGDLIIGADSHTCTYGALGAFSTGVGSTDLAAAMITGRLWFKVPPSIKFIYYHSLNRWVGGKDLILYTIGQIGVEGALYRAMEFTGEVIERLPISDRLTMCNMAIEAGGKNGIIAPDKLTLSYLKEIGGKAGKIYQSDPEAVYEQVVEIDCGKIEPQVAFPPLPGNSRPISEVGEVFISQVVIGSCTNGRLEDLRLAAQILKGKKIHPEVRMIILPGTQQIYLQALREGLIEVFILAGAVVSTPTCGPCLGGHMGILAPGEVAIATTNRNFVGRMGHPKSKVYLSNPAVAAASALAGKIIGPEEK